MTFAREWMGLLCLGIVWVNVLLICASAWKDRAELSQLRRSLRKPSPGQFGLLAGKICPEEAPNISHHSSPMIGAAYRLIQRGHTCGDGKIYFHDRAYESTIEPFRLRTVKGVTPVHRAGGELAWVWPTNAAVKERTECPDLAHFDKLAEPAFTARGATRVTDVSAGQGDNVFVAGVLGADGSLSAEHETPLLVSLEDPRLWLDRQCLKIELTVLGFFVVGIALTAFVVAASDFGLWAKLGAMALLFYFLLIQPAGVALSESVSLPHRAKREGVWNRDKLEFPKNCPSRLGYRLHASMLPLSRSSPGRSANKRQQTTEH